MRSTTKLMKNWQFTGPDGKTVAVDLPHTWNNIDGQDGGNDYWRGTCTYKTRFAAPTFDAETQQVWLQFEGVNASAKVVLNGHEVMTHDGGYATRYSSLQQDVPVEEGQTVAAGEVIGYVGSTSAAESRMGPHLHFSVSRDGAVIDPHDYVNGGE